LTTPSEKAGISEMRRKVIRKFIFYIGLIFGIFLLGLTGRMFVTMLGLNQDSRLERNWEFVAHQKNISILLRDAELGVYAYFISGNRSFLPNPKNLRERYEAESRLLKISSDDNVNQKSNFEKFQVLANNLLQQMENEIADSSQKSAAPLYSSPAFLNSWWQNIQELRDLENVIETKQAAMIVLRENEVQENYRNTLLLCLGASVALMILLVLFYKMNQRYSMELSASKNVFKSENDDLKNDIALRVEQLTDLSHHLLAVAEQEKASLARELHDELGSNLTAMRLDLLAVLESLKEKDIILATQLRQTLQILQKTFENKRRIIENLRPSTLECLGFATAIRTHGEEVARRSGLHVDVKIDEDSIDIDSARAIAMYRIVQESLTNTVKYAKAKHVSISLTRNLKGHCLRISDDGVGVAKSVIRKHPSHGILGMRERATLLGGSFDMRSGTGGVGTHIEVFLPYPNN
jgi:signal transduction histidine kinase